MGDLLQETVNDLLLGFLFGKPQGHELDELLPRDLTDGGLMDQRSLGVVNVKDMIPYSRLNTTIRSCPTGFPLALKISEVTPIKDAAKVRWFSLSKIQKDSTISATEEHHSAISVFVKYRIADFLRIIPSPKKKHPGAHLLRPNDAHTNALHILLLGSSYLYVLIHYTTRRGKKQVPERGKQKPAPAKGCWLGGCS